MGQIRRLAAAELQGDRVLALVVVQESVHAAVHDGPGGQHLGVKPRMRTQQSVKVTTVPVSPVEHGRHAGAPGGDSFFGGQHKGHGQTNGGISDNRA